MGIFIFLSTSIVCQVKFSHEHDVPSASCDANKANDDDFYIILPLKAHIS